MPFRRVIPCLDVTEGRVVKGVQFQSLRDVGDPAELAAAYSDGGADELVLLDITATVHDVATMVSVVERVADRVAIPFTVGGGIRSASDAARLIAAGADRVSVNSAALARPQLLSEIADQFGRQAVVVAIDYSKGQVFSHGGRRPTERSVVAWAHEATAAGAGEILLTSMEHDGRREGFDLDTVADVRAAVDVAVIASGGAGSFEHVAAALRVTDAALVASIVHEDPEQLVALRHYLRDNGVALRRTPVVRP